MDKLKQKLIDRLEKLFETDASYSKLIHEIEDLYISKVEFYSALEFIPVIWAYRLKKRLGLIK